GVCHALWAGDRPRQGVGVRRTDRTSQSGPVMHPPPPAEDLRRLGPHAARIHRRGPAMELHAPATIWPGTRSRFRYRPGPAKPGSRPATAGHAPEVRWVNSESVDSTAEQSWYIDPFGNHEDRWISAGNPMALVRDDVIESNNQPHASLPPLPLVRSEVPPS